MTEAAAPRREASRLAFSPAAFRWAAYAALLALFVVTVSGATVRLTGSGLGCENWPRCGQTFTPAQGFHSYVEFGNRVVGLGVGIATLAAAFVAWRARVPRPLLLLALGLPLLVGAQGVLGGITVLYELHPLIVMGHFLLSLVTIALAVVVCLGAERLVRGRAAPAVPRWTRHMGLALVPLAAVLVVTGAFVTAAGPHPGGDDIERLGDLERAMWVHVRASAAFGLGFLAVAAALWRFRGRVRTETVLAGAVLALLVGQMIVGEVQWRNQLPWWLVLVHVTLATAIWAGVVALAAVLRRPPRLGSANP